MTDQLLDPPLESLVDILSAGLRANSCTVSGPLNVDDARDTIVRLAVASAEAAHAAVACNADVPIPGLYEALAGRGVEILATTDARWSERLPEVAVGITGSRVAVAQPAAIALAAAPGSPRGTSLVPPEHICVVRVADVMATLAEAMVGIADGDLPSALTWIGGPSRTGDLEMITTLGVHGPRAVEVVLLA